jgi:hypothetical protein
VVIKAPGASHVDGWYPTELKPFIGGSCQDIEVGDSEHGFGHIWSRMVYKVGKNKNETHAFNL